VLLSCIVTAGQTDKCGADLCFDQYTSRQAWCYPVF